MKVKRKPIEYDAIQWLGNNIDEVEKIIGRKNMVYIPKHMKPDDLMILTKIGMRVVGIGNWVVQDGDYYKILDPNVFDSMYEVI